MKIDEILEYYKHYCYILPKWYIEKFFYDRKKKKLDAMEWKPYCDAIKLKNKELEVTQMMPEHVNNRYKEWPLPTITTKYELLPSLSAWNVENDLKYVSLSGTYIDNELEKFKKECSVYPQFKNTVVNDDSIKLPSRPKTTKMDKELKDLAAIYDDIAEKYKATNEKE